MSIVKATNHKCKDHYKLKDFKKLFTCDGCKMKGHGKRYQCEVCGHELHRECKSPKVSISHKHFGDSIFTFHKEPFKCHEGHYSKCCDACGKDICGFNYHCKADNLDLHPCCWKLKEKLTIDDMIFHLRAKFSSSKCFWCKKKKISGGGKTVPGWSYVCSSNEYHFHVYCMMEMVHGAFMKNGEMGLEKIELRQLVKSNRKRGINNRTFQTIKSVLTIIVAALLGDPTVLISNAFVELVWRGSQ